MTREEQIKEFAFKDSKEVLEKLMKDSPCNRIGHNDVSDIVLNHDLNAIEWASAYLNWHCTADGDLPKEDILTDNTLIVYGDNIGFQYRVNYMDGAFGNYYWDYDNGDDFDIIDGVEYWMEIKLPNNK